MLWVVDYTNPCAEALDCLIVDAESYDEAYDKAIQELKDLKIPKRYILKIEEFK